VTNENCVEFYAFVALRSALNLAMVLMQAFVDFVVFDTTVYFDNDALLDIVAVMQTKTYDWSVATERSFAIQVWMDCNY